MKLNRNSHYKYAKDIKLKNGVTRVNKFGRIFANVGLAFLLSSSTLTAKQLDYSEDSIVMEETEEPVVIEDDDELTFDEMVKLITIRNKLREIEKDTQKNIQEIYEINESSLLGGTNNASGINYKFNEIDIKNNPVYQENNKKNEQYYELFNEYCGYYGLDTLAVYNLAKMYTNNFTDENFLSTYTIGNTEFYSKPRIFPTPESGIICFIRSLALVPEDFNISANEITTGSYTEYDKNYESLIATLSDYFKVDKVRMLAIIYHETGRLTSDAYNNRNNPAGLIYNEELKRFATKEQGFVEAIANVYFRFYQDNPNISLAEMGKVYCPVGVSNDDGTNKYWVNNVDNLVEEIRSNSEIFNAVEEEAKQRS